VKRRKDTAIQFGDNGVRLDVSDSCVETDVSRKGRGKEKVVDVL